MFLSFGLIEAGQFWSLLPWSRALCGSVAQCSQAARSSLHSSEPSMELMQAKLSVCCPKRFIGATCFPYSSITQQQMHQDRMLIPVLPRPQ